MYWSYEFLSGKFYPGVRDVWTVKEVVEKTAVLGEKTYLIDAPTGRRFSYEDSNRTANRMADSLRTVGLCKGDRLGFLMGNAPEYVFAFFASAKLGLIEVPFNTNFQAAEIAYMVEKAGISTVLTEADAKFIRVLAEAARQAPVLRNVIIAGDLETDLPAGLQYFSLRELMAEASEANPDVVLEESDAFSIIFTSGTTGLPKGAVTTNKMALLGAMSIGAMRVGPESRMYTCLPFFHTNAQIFTALGMRLLGASMVLDDRFSPSRIWQPISQYQADSFSSLGGMMQILDSIFAAGEVPEHPCKMVWVAGTPADLWERFEKKFKVEIYEGYGMTEVPVAFNNCHPDRSRRKIGSVGRPLFWDLGRQVKLVDDQGREVTLGVGEVLQKGDGFVTQGYWNAPEANREAFDDDGWFRTGDVLRVDEDGDYFFVDRNKFLIRVGGENVSAFEVEAVVNSHPAVAQSAAIPVDDRFKGEEIKVLIKRAEGAADVDFKELVALCAGKLAYFKVPRYFEIIDEFPKTPTERIQKIKLKEWERQKTDHGWDRDQHLSRWRELSAAAKE